MRVRPLLPPDLDLDALSPTDRLYTRMGGIFAHRPRLAPAFAEFGAALGRDAELSPRLRELVRLRIAFHNQCRTCMSIRYSSGRDDGVSEDLVCSLAQPDESPGLSERERAALRFADLFATDHLAIDDEFFVGLRRHFDDGEIVELAMVCAHYVGSGRLMAVMHVTEDLPDAARAEGVVAPWALDGTVEVRDV